MDEQLMQEELAEKAERLLQIREQMDELLDESKDILESIPHEVDGGMTWERAKLYWWAHIVTALSREHDYLGSSMFTMQDAVEELEKLAYNDKE